MKALLITFYYPPEAGAPQSRLSAQTTAMLRRGHAVDVLTTMPNYPVGRPFQEYAGRMFQAEDRAGSRVYRTWSLSISNLAPQRRLLKYLTFVATGILVLVALMGTTHLPGIVREIRPDVIEAHFAVGYGDIAAAAAPKGCLLAVHCVGSDALVLPKRNAGYRMLLRNTFRRADLVVCYGEHVKEAVSPLIAPGKDIRVWIRGIPMPPAMIRKDRDPNRPLRLVTTRKLWRWYRHDLAVDVLRKLRDSGIDARLDIFGDGEAEAELPIQAQNLGIADVCVFHGRCLPAQIMATLPECDLYVSTVPSDGISASLMEAVCGGLFPIIPDIPGNRFFQGHGIRLGLYQPSDGDSLYAAIMSYVGRRQEYDQIIRDNATAMSPIIDIEQNVASLAGLYAELVHKRHPLPARDFVPEIPACDAGPDRRSPAPDVVVGMNR
jgi:glycosyltransferase involved in cell wall biosynthesis